MLLNGIINISANDLPSFAGLVQTPFIAIKPADIAAESIEKYERLMKILTDSGFPVPNRLRISGDMLIIAYSGNKTMDYITSNLKDADIPFLSYPDKTAD